MNILIAGSRDILVDNMDITSALLLISSISGKQLIEPPTIISGAARGVDACAEVLLLNID